MSSKEKTRAAAIAFKQALQTTEKADAAYIAERKQNGLQEGQSGVHLQTYIAWQKAYMASDRAYSVWLNTTMQWKRNAKSTVEYLQAKAELAACKRKRTTL